MRFRPCESCRPSTDGFGLRFFTTVIYFDGNRWQYTPTPIPAYFFISFARECKSTTQPTIKCLASSSITADSKGRQGKCRPFFIRADDNSFYISCLCESRGKKFPKRKKYERITKKLSTIQFEIRKFSSNGHVFDASIFHSQGEDTVEYFLGLTPSGIIVLRNKTKVGNYFW